MRCGRICTGLRSQVLLLRYLQSEVLEVTLEPALDPREGIVEAHRLHLRLAPDGLEPFGCRDTVRHPLGEPTLHGFPVGLPVRLVLEEVRHHVLGVREVALVELPRAHTYHRGCQEVAV